MRAYSTVRPEALLSAAHRSGIAFGSKLRALGACGLFLASGCTLIADLSQNQCSVDEDCASDSGPPLACVDRICAPMTVEMIDCFADTSPVSREQPVTFRAELVDDTSRAVVENAGGRVCGALDTECAEPTVAPTTSNDAGLLSFSLPQGFDGYAEITSDRHVPTLAAINRLTEDNNRVEVALLTTADLFELALGAGSSIDASRGHLLFRTTDCDGTRLGDIVVVVEPAEDATSVFYFRDGLVSADATSTQAGDGPRQGTGGVLNIPVGTARVRFFRQIDGEVASEELTSFAANIRAGAVTMVFLGPSDSSAETSQTENTGNTAGGNAS